jgi:hypothetical protein
MHAEELDDSLLRVVQLVSRLLRLYGTGPAIEFREVGGFQSAVGGRIFQVEQHFDPRAWKGVSKRRKVCLLCGTPHQMGAHGYVRTSQYVPEKRGDAEDPALRVTPHDQEVRVFPP